jgi:hypothetical protein
MKRTASRIALLIVLTFAFTAVAHAVAPQRTFVSAQQGNDANVAADPPCSTTLPCRQFNVAIGAVLAGGEVVALDTGGYGPVTVTKSVALVAPTGIYASIRAQAAGSSAITVSAAGTDTVVLRGLTLVGVGGQTGINVTSVASLHVEGCVISGFSSRGIFVNLSADGSHIFIKDTIVRNNNRGIQILTTVGTVRASIDNCRAERNSDHGFVASVHSRVTINRSVASGNGSNGFYAASGVAGEETELSCEECVSSNNGAYGFLVDAVLGGLPTIRVSHSSATNNGLFGFAQFVGVFESLGNNLVRGNTSGDTTGTIAVIGAR